MTQVRDRGALHAGAPEQGQADPDLFALYIAVLKIVLATVVGSALVAGVVKAVQSGGVPGDSLASTLGIAWNGAFVAIGAVTLGFTLLQHDAAARSQILRAWAPLLRLRLAEPPRAGRLHHLAAVAAHALFILWWTGAIQPWWFIPPSVSPGLRLDLTPAWESLYWPVLALSVAVVVVNGLRLAWPTSRRLDHGLGLGLQLGLLAVAVAALSAGFWVDISVSGVSADAIPEVDRAITIGLQAALVVIACVSAVLAGFHVRGLFRNESPSMP